MTRTPSQPPAHAAPGEDGSPAPGDARQRLGAPACRKLLADLGDLFWNRKQQRAGLYLPLVRIDRGE